MRETAPPPKARGGVAVLSITLCCALIVAYGIVNFMNINFCGKEWTVHESLSGVSEHVLFSVLDESRRVPISEWTEPSLIVLRALELAYDRGSYAIGPLSHCQVSPILFVNYWGIDDELDLARSIGSDPSVARNVGNLMAFAGGTLEPGASYSHLEAPMYMCLRFPDNELVREMARKKGSVAQAELERRHEENHS